MDDTIGNFKTMIVPTEPELDFDFFVFVFLNKCILAKKKKSKIK